jgi:hypothetical protein
LDEHTLNKLRKLDLEDPKGDNVNKSALDSYEEEDKVDMIDLVVQSQDKDLLKPLTTYELKEDKKTLIKMKTHNLNSFLQELHALKQAGLGRRCSEDKEIHQRETLASIIQDILHSELEEGLVEDIDCY